MAKKKRKSHRRRHRRGIHGFSAKGAMNQVQPLLLGIAGGIAAQAITNHLLKDAKMDDKIKAGIPVVGGVILKMMDKSGGMLSQVGSGMALVGGVNVAKQFLPGITGITDADISGIEEDIVIEGDPMLTVNGSESSLGNMLTVSGIDEEISGEQYD